MVEPKMPESRNPSLEDSLWYQWANNQINLCGDKTKNYYFHADEVMDLKQFMKEQGIKDYVIRDNILGIVGVRFKSAEDLFLFKMVYKGTIVNEALKRHIALYRFGATVPEAFMDTFY